MTETTRFSNKTPFYERVSDQIDTVLLEIQRFSNNNELLANQVNTLLDSNQALINRTYSLSNDIERFSNQLDHDEKLINLTTDYKV